MTTLIQELPSVAVERVDPVRDVMTGKSIVCFAKDWSETPTSNNHVMAELARAGNRVLWLNSVATRSPKLTSRRDAGKVLRKLKQFFAGATAVQDNLWVFTPVVLPLPHSRWARAVNRVLLRWMLPRVMRSIGMSRPFQLWSFLPNVADYLSDSGAGPLGESLVVYYCTDDWSKFSYVDGPKIAAAERRLVARADVVFATAQPLVELHRPANPNTHLARHGVDHAAFAAALDVSTPVPSDVAMLPKPIIGFYGTIHDWIDQDLIATLAQRHPQWSFVLVGREFVDVSRLRRHANIHLLGRRPHGQLPAYCRAFDVGIIPYALSDPRMTAVNPIKLREYLSAGLPVVATAIPEATLYPGACAAAADVETFDAALVRAVDGATGDGATGRRRRRSDAMKPETWSHRVAAVAEQVVRAAAARGEP